MKECSRVRFGTALAVAGVLVLAGCDERPFSRDRGSGKGAATSSASDGTLSYDALVEVIRDPDAFATARALGARLPRLGSESLPALQQALRSARFVEMSAGEFALLMSAWARHAPAEAAVFALREAPPAFRAAAIHSAVTPWAKVAPEEVLAAIRDSKLSEDGVGAAAQIALVRGWYDSGQPGLEEYIRDLGPGFARNRANFALGDTLLRARGPDALVGWAETARADDALQREIQQSAISALVPLHLDAARRLCDAHCGAASGYPLRTRIVDHWSRHDAAAAFEWVAATVPDVGQTVVHAFFRWAERDRAAAIRWMKEQTKAEPPPSWLRPLFPTYVRLLADESPSEALRWAGRIEDEQLRESWMVEVARSWREREPEAAEAWLRESPLSEEARAQARAAAR